MTDECWDPLGNQSPPKHVIRCKNAAILPKMCSPELGQKSKRKKKKQLNIIFYPFASSTLLGRFVPFLARRVRPQTQSSKSNFKSIDSWVWGLRVPKIWGFPLTLIVALTTVLRTTVLHCDVAQSLETMHSRSLFPFVGTIKYRRHCKRHNGNIRVPVTCKRRLFTGFRK